MRFTGWFVAVLLVVGCGGSETYIDAAVHDARVPDGAIVDGQPLDGQPLDAQPLDAQPLDGQPLDAQPLDAQPLDAASLDATIGLDATTPFTQGGPIAITEILARSSTIEWIEVTNISGGPVELTAYDVRIASDGGVARTVRAASDPDGLASTPVTIPAGGRAVGVPNPASATDIPGVATFVFGAPGALGADALDDTGDDLSIDAALVGDRVDFTVAATTPGGAVPATAYPLVVDVSTELDPSAIDASAVTGNDGGGAWCAHVFRGSSPGAANRSCRAFVINELVYDHDSFTTGVDDGQEYVELAGPAGGSLANLVIARVEGTGAAAGTIDGEIALTGGRMPLDGLYVVADDDPLDSGITQVAGADQIVNLVMENGPDAVQLVSLSPSPSLLDALAYGAVTATVDLTRGLAISEGTTAPDPTPTSYTIDLARRVDAADTDSNAADFRYDPSPTPGAPNGTSQLALSMIVPDDANAGNTVTVQVFGTDFTDAMTLDLVMTPAPAATCTAPATNVLSCSIVYPPGGSGLAERVDVELSARPESGESVTGTAAFTWTDAVNETGGGGECDYCNLQSPTALTLAPGATSPVIYGQIYEAGLTDTTTGGPAPGILAEVGYGPAASDPRVVDWTWSPTTFNVETGPGSNNDEYMGTLTAPAATGTYAFAYRYSLDGGLTWSYADADGAGSNTGLDFSAAACGTMAVQ